MIDSSTASSSDYLWPYEFTICSSFCIVFATRKRCQKQTLALLNAEVGCDRFQNSVPAQHAACWWSGVLSLLVVNTIAIAQKKHLGKLQRRQAEVRW